MEEIKKLKGKKIRYCNSISTDKARVLEVIIGNPSFIKIEDLEDYTIAYLCLNDIKFIEVLKENGN